MDMTTLRDVKNLLDINDEQTKYDAILKQMIVQTSAQAEAYLGRAVFCPGINDDNYVEVFDFEASQSLLCLNAYPVISVSDVRYDEEHTFGEDSIVDTENYFIDKPRGFIRPEIAFYPGPGVFQVIYKGGMANSVAALATAYPALTSAIAQEVAIRYQRKNSGGLIAATSSGSSATIRDRSLFDKSVIEVLDMYARY